MANTIPCPNPVCTHQFSLAELQSAAQLLCPKCGFRMQGRGGATAPAKPAAATMKPATAVKPPATPKAVAATSKPAPPPMAMPIAAPKPAAPLAAPISTSPIATAVVQGEPPAVSGEESVADGTFFNPGDIADAGTLVRTSGKSKRGFNWLRALVMLFVVGFALCVVIVAVTVTLWFFLGPDGLTKLNPKDTVAGNIYYGQIRGAKDGHERVYKLALIKDEWEVDREILARFEAHQAWKHRKEDFWFAVLVQDFGTLKPRDAEMLRIGIDKLESYYGDALELGKKAEPAKIGDRAAQKIQFKGQVKAANWLGECYMFFNNGIGYWLFIASPDWSTVERFAEELPEKNFFIMSERKGWREQPAPVETFASSNSKLTVTVPKGVWEKHPNPKDLDENGVLFLSGKYLRDKDNRKNATFLVFTYEKKDDLKTAMKDARDYLDKKVKNDNENYKVALATEVAAGQTDLGAVEGVGNRSGRLIDLKRLFNEESQRFYFLAVVNEPDVGYAILGDCTWDSRQIWRQEFLDLLKSMNFKKGE